MFLRGFGGLQVPPLRCGDQGVKAEGLCDEGVARLRSCPRLALMTATKRPRELATPMGFGDF